MKNPNAKSEETDWEVRPGGMLVQRRDDQEDDDDDLHHKHNHETSAASSGGPIIKINVAHGPAQHELFVPAHSTFGELKMEIAQKTGLECDKQRVLFRGKEKEDKEHLNSAGVKDKSKVLLLENPASKEKNVEEMMSSKEKVEETTDSKENKVEEMKETKEMSTAFAAVAGVRKEVDKLSERVAALEVAVNSGTKVAAEEFDVSAELLMRELLKLDGIEAEGEAKLQRKAEVRRVQNFHETLDKLKARNSNPFSNSSKAVSVTTKWETFDSGMGSLTAPSPMSSSTDIKQDWEQFD
ncbi:BAG family molecular chaperone regulator 4 [Durio zibethinus]|uniref:BAG family molecular chaperone regulator 4 n=1 Tax=Durio zibethinus TaxID=66656 RepID=A0A6P6ASN5_DURZI|nr:BAG family molecular chaperone regulator 4 [Durio zibethinus]